VVTALTALGAVGVAAPSYADDTVTVQGTAFPDPARAALSLVGCADLYERADEPLVPRIGRGPDAAVAGSRSLGWDLSGGNAVGALFPTTSMLGTTTATMAVNATGPASGVAYAGYQEPGDAGTSLLWLGRSELSTPGGAWQTIDATTRPYVWTKYDMLLRRPVATGPGAPTTVAGFAAAHGGDGPGVYTIGFGCDGTPFSMDQLRVGRPGAVTTYDVEALRTTVTISASGETKDGSEVTLTGQLATGTGDPVPHATLVLERRSSERSGWQPVLVADVEHGIARATVPGDEPASYRWRFVERPVAEGSTSEAWLPDLLPPVETEPPSPTPTGQPSPTPTQQPSLPTPTPSGSPLLAESASAPAAHSSADDSASPSESDSHGTR
jgi:hypothetical protein